MKDTTRIVEEMKDELERRTGASITAGGDMDLRLNAVAAELSSLWAQVEWTKNQAFPQSASGASLDLHAAGRGLKRGLAVAASGVLRFETSEVRATALLVPAGTVCLNAAGAEFLTTQSARIEAGGLFCTANAIARFGGEAGNVPANSVTLMSQAPVGIFKCFNPAAFSGGSGQESDEELRKRVLSSFASLPNGSNVAYYEAAALDTPGVGAVSVAPRARGVGTVDITIASNDGVPSAALVETVRAKLAAQREICVDLAVSAPTTVSVPISVSIETDGQSSFETVSAAVKAALGTYFDGRLLGKKVLLARLGSVIFGVPGLANYSISAPAADVAITGKQLPCLGAVTVTGS
ncbi:MAG: baseplate J/gp47 family protein [Oscillospiraceae bacterium]